jgi:hypothetical protein
MAHRMESCTVYAMVHTVQVQTVIYVFVVLVKASLANFGEWCCYQCSQYMPIELVSFYPSPYFLHLRLQVHDHLDPPLCLEIQQGREQALASTSVTFLEVQEYIQIASKKEKVDI